MSSLLKFCFLSTLFFQNVFSSTASVLNHCYQDDCLRAFQHTSLIAASFCAGYIGTAMAPISTPGFVISSCTSQTSTPVATRLSTACACLSSQMASATSSVQTSTSTSHTTSSSTLSTSTSTSISNTLPPILSSTLSSSMLSASSKIISSSSSTSSLTPSPTSASSNLVQDPGFEQSSSAAWQQFDDGATVSITVVSTTANSGSKSCELSNGYSEIGQQIDFSSFAVGQTLYFSAAINLDTTSLNGNDCYLRVSTDNQDFFDYDLYFLGGTPFIWATVSATYSVEDGDADLYLTLDCETADPQAIVFVDDVYFGPTLSS